MQAPWRATGWRSPTSAAVAKVLRRRRIAHVLHFTSPIPVPGLIADPSGDGSVNVDGSRSPFEAMRSEGLRRIVFLSTAAVHTHGFDRPIREDDRIAPATPCGTSKPAVEHLLQGYAKACGMGATALRYVNAAGADLDGRRGEAYRAETHAIPPVIEAALGLRRPLRFSMAAIGTRRMAPASGTSSPGSIFPTRICARSTR